MLPAGVDAAGRANVWESRLTFAGQRIGGLSGPLPGALTQAQCMYARHCQNVQDCIQREASFCTSVYYILGVCQWIFVFRPCSPTECCMSGILLHVEEWCQMNLKLTDERISALNKPGQGIRFGHQCHNQDTAAVVLIKHEPNFEIQQDISKPCVAIQMPVSLSKPVLARGNPEKPLLSLLLVK